MEVLFSPSFVRKFKGMPLELREEILEKIEMFKDELLHKQLKVHKLSGRLEERYSFSVNYKIRVIFRYSSDKPRIAYLLTVGDHEIYS